MEIRTKDSDPIGVDFVPHRGLQAAGRLGDRMSTQDRSQRMPQVELIHGSIKATTLRRVLEDAKQIVIVSAFTTPKGLAEVRKPILECAKRGGSATLFLGIDRAGIASSELVRDLAALLKKAGSRLRVVLLVETGRSFLHAKIFAARKKGSAEILVGSFNLTGSGLSTNHEFAARLLGNASNFFDDLGEFVNSIPGTKELTLENAGKLAEALINRGSEPEDSETIERRRRETAERLQKIIAALEVPSGRILHNDEIPSLLRQLLVDGGFWSYQFDLEKLSIPSGLTGLYEQGLLPREKSGDAGTAKMKIPTGVSASFPLIPPHRQKQFSGLAKRLGKAFCACGFETPFGYWVPNQYLERLQDSAKDVARRLPTGKSLEVEVRAFVRQHKAKLSETTEAILLHATKAGVQHPARWRNSRDERLVALKRRLGPVSEDEWPNSSAQTEALAYIREKLLAIAEKLDPDLAIAKLQRIRPELLPVPVELDEPAIRRLLECMTWAVAEDRGQRNTKPAARALSSRRGGEPPTLQQLQDLSQALLEEVDGAEKMFFALFGPPPYWVSEQEESDDSELDDDEDDDDE